MSVRRVFSFACVFGVGILVGGLFLRWRYSHGVDLSTAQKNAINILDRRPVGASIGDNRIVQAVKRIEPTVVNIDTVGRAHSEEDSNLPWMDQEVRGKGSGVVITPDGYIVTNSHVIDGASRIRVTLTDGHWYFAHLIGRDPETDLAVVRVDASNLQSAVLGDSDQLQVGEWSIAVGNPLGLGSTVTLGVISALNRRNLQIEEGRNLDGAIQTDAAINRGNSGGALANINGDLIGINTAILSSGPNGGSIGLGFSIPSNTVRRVTRGIISNYGIPAKKIKQAWLGIQFSAVPEEIAISLSLPMDQGVMVQRVLPETPASIAGIHDGDILLSINNKPIKSSNDVKNNVRDHNAGDKVRVHLMRPGEHLEKDVTITLQEKPENMIVQP